jgi:hypothetical protein
MSKRGALQQHFLLMQFSQNLILISGHEWHSDARRLPSRAPG